MPFDFSSHELLNHGKLQKNHFSPVSPAHVNNPFSDVKIVFTSFNDEEKTRSDGADSTEVLSRFYLICLAPMGISAQHSWNNIMLRDQFEFQRPAAAVSLYVSQPFLPIQHALRKVTPENLLGVKKIGVLNSKRNISRNLIITLMCIHLFLSLAIQLSNKGLNMTAKFKWLEQQIFEMQVDLCRKEFAYLIAKMFKTICFINRRWSQIPMIIWTQLLVNFLVLRPLRTNDSSCIHLLVHACLTLCNFDNIMGAINKTLISIILFGINLRFLFSEVNSPLSSVKFYNKSYCFYTEYRNTIYLICEKIKNCTGDYERRSESP